ncbi:hypothetical protein ACH5RR_022066 [Cinchona calisaya]|uniref:AB hydrolase-1 domain-containing protein n=1 Tax=Cinchona calisaya TaxID=153742 RepID=A0ABD2Z7V5_9GENT
MVNVFTIVKPIVHGVMKLAGVTSHKVEIEPGTIMNFWVPTETIKNPNQKLINKPPVVLIHGFFADGILTWLFQVLALTRNYAVYVPDLLFFGDSITDRNERTTSFQAECLAKGLMKLGVERCSVVGLSYGGMVAFKLGKLYPHLVDSMIVSGTVIELTQSISNKSLEKLGFSRWSDILMPETVEGLKRLLSIGSHGSLFTRFPRFFYSDFLQVMFHNRRERDELLEALVVPDREFTPTSYSQRIYLLWGDDDKIFNLEVANNIKLQLKDKASLYCIENAGHISQLERPGTYNHHLKTILGSLLQQNK